MFVCIKRRRGMDNAIEFVSLTLTSYETCTVSQIRGVQRLRACLKTQNSTNKIRIFVCTTHIPHIRNRQFGIFFVSRLRTRAGRWRGTRGTELQDWMHCRLLKERGRNLQ